ncbi:hypothetical protein D9619_006873 [Psilocybe cf. subviscida]|uniref:Uncharacterized protein n=1 Tax=Psilocybe cf. subviscida TaxID=2480587 RepID=A0A8H5B435_9AGAR|nr:hypothetical protein D9619_006873 [Psilocybe cf. subviscida]
MPPSLPGEAEQKFVLEGVMLSLFAYGVEFVIFIQCIMALQSGANQRRGFPRWILLTYTTVMFLLGTAYIMANTSYKILAYTTHRNFPGGPAQWININYSSPTTFSANVFAVLSSWGADALLLYRCFVIYSSSFKPLRPVLFLPVLLFIGELICGILLLVQVSHAPITIWNTINLGLPYFTITTVCNITITVCIATPLLLHRRRLLRAFGKRNEYTKPYTSAASILIESSALYAAVATIFIGFYARNNPASHLFLAVLSQVQVIAPFLVILRVANRKSWSSTTNEELTAISVTNNTNGNQSHAQRSILSSRGRPTTVQQGEFIQFEVHTTTTVKHDRSPSPAGQSGIDTPPKVDDEDYIPGGRVTPLHE